MKLRQSLCAAAILAASVGTIPAFGLVVGGTATGSNQASLSSSLLNTVGKVNGSSCVYLGNGWVITASHVGAGTVTLMGHNYSAISSAQYLYNDDNTKTDVILFQIDVGSSNLGGATIATTSTNVSDAVTMAGYGYTRGSTLNYYNATPIYNANNQITGYNVASDTNSQANAWGYSYSSSIGTLTTGTNTVSYLQTKSYNPGLNTYTNSLITNFTIYRNGIMGSTAESQVANGDSGGAMFSSSGELIGILIAKAPIFYINNSETYIAMTDQFSYAADLYSYYDQIQAIIVPEPASLTMMALGAGAIMLRRRKA